MSGGLALAVLRDLFGERDAQDAKWGEQNHPDGTSVEFTPEADSIRATTNQAARDGHLTWTDILAEEFAEAICETDPVKLRAELVQVAAVAVAWIECIDRRSV